MFACNLVALVLLCVCVGACVRYVSALCVRVGSCWIMRVVGGSIIRQFSATQFFLIDVNAVAMLHIKIMHKDFQPLNFIICH